MSKYIKLDDALSEADRLLGIFGIDFNEGVEYGILMIKFALLDLPTIEVSEDCISRQQAIEILCSSRCGERARGCPVHSCPIIEKYDNLPPATPTASDDCISRADTIDKLKSHKAFFMQAWNNDFSIMDKADKSRVDELNHCISVIVNAPSVVTKDKCKVCQQYDIGYDDGRADMLQQISEKVKKGHK